MFWKDVVPNRMAEQTSLEKELVHALDERDFWETKCDELAPQAKQLSMLLPFVRFSRFHLFGNFATILPFLLSHLDIYSFINLHAIAILCSKWPTGSGGLIPPVPQHSN